MNESEHICPLTSRYSKMMDWQTNKAPTECIEYLLKNEAFSDVVFEVGENHERIKAHKLILAMRSPVFERMFYGALPEKDEPILIEDLKPDAFKALLR